MTAKTKHIQIPATRSVDIAQQKFNDAVRQQLNMLGGTKLDRVITMRDVLGGGLKGIKLTGAVIDIDAQPGTGNGGSDAETPTVPTNVQGFAGTDVTFLKWDRPTFRGFAYTEIYRFDADSLALAQRVASITSPAFSEYVGYSKTVYYWVRHVNTAGISSAFHATNGVKLETKPDYEAIQEALSEQINESYLTALLRARIDLIDVSNNGGLVAAQNLLSSQLEAADSRLTAANNQLLADLNSAKNLLQGQINTNGTSIVSLQDADEEQAQQLNALTLRATNIESTVLQLDSVSDDHASRLVSIEFVNGTQGSAISSLQTTTATHATAISRLGVYDTAAGKYAFIKTLQEADANQVSRIGTLEAADSANKSRITTVEQVTAAQASKVATLETENGSNKNRISTLEATDATQASRLVTLESDNGTNKGKITTLESTTAGQASRLNVLEADNGSSKSRLTSLETADATQASRIEQLSFSQGDGITVKALEGLSASISGKNVPSVLPNSNIYINSAGNIEIKGNYRYYSAQAFAVDPDRKYRVRFVVRQVVDDVTTGALRSLVYAGVHCLDNSYNSLGNNRYHAVSAHRLLVSEGRRVFEGDISTIGTSTNTFLVGARYVRAMFIVNHASGNGTVEVESIEIRDITETAAVEDVARAYTDTKTGEIRAERTIKVQADGKVAGIGLIAGATTGSKLIFTAEQIAFVKPGAPVAGAIAPFIYDAASDTTYLNVVFIRDLTASKIAGGVLNLNEGHIRNLTVFGTFSPPDHFLQKSHFSDKLARELAWVDPNAVATGGTLSKDIYPHEGTVAMGGFLSGGQAPTITVGGGVAGGYSEVLTSPVSGTIDVQVLRNNVAVTVNGVSTFRLTISSSLITDEALPPSQRRWMATVSGGVNGVCAAVANNTTTNWSVRVVSTTGAGADGFVARATVFESFGSSGGLIANTMWSAISDKPATATRWPKFSEITDLPSTLNADVFFTTNQANRASMRLSWVGDVPRLRIGGSGAGSSGPFQIQGPADAVWANFSGAGLTVPSRVYTPILDHTAPIALLNNTAAQGINVGQLLVSSAYADVSKVPVNGAYLKGGLVSDGELVMNSQSIRIRGGASGSWARGVLFESAAGDRYGGMGALGNGQALTRLYFGLGESPWLSDTRINLTPGEVSITGRLLLAGGRLVAPGAASHNHGSLSVKGAKAGYAGIAFEDANAVFMLRTSDAYSGVYVNNNTWRWAFDGAGQLVAGSIPWANMVNVPSLVLTANGVASAGGLGVTNTSNTTGHGLSLYNGAVLGQPIYGMMFAGTETFGTHGNVTNAWATYLTMSNHSDRGWIFKAGTGAAGNVASISGGGHARFNGNVTALDNISTSDRRTKHRLKPINNALAKVGQLTGYTFNRKGKKGREAGYMAQDLQKVLPQGVTELDGILRVSNSAAIGLLIQAVNELSAKVAKLEGCR